MGVTVATTRVACNTGTGNQSITTSDLGGLTPKAAILIVTSATTDGTVASDYLLSYGAVTGATNRWCVGGSDEDGQATTDIGAMYQSDVCVSILLPSDQSEDGRADFSAWITNGITINWSNAPGSAYLLTAIFFAGTDLSAHANNFDLLNTVDNTVDVTDPGFEPDLLITAMLFTMAGPYSAGDHLKISFGFVHNDGASGITQRSIATVNRNSRATSDVSGQARSDGGAIQLNNFAGDIDTYADFDTFDSSGFSAHARNDGFNNRDIAYLALSFGGAVSSYVGTYATPTSTGSDTDTGPGFTPQFVLLIENLTEAFATAYTDNRAGGVGFSSITSSAQYANSVNAEDAQGTSDTQSLSDNVAIRMPDDDGTDLITATFTSFGASGPTYNFSAVHSTAKNFLVLAVEEDAGGDLTISVSEAVSVAEVTTLIVSDPQISVSDGVTIAEAITAELLSFVSVADAVTVGEAVQLELENNIDVSDGIAVADTPTADIPTLPASVAEAISVADTPAVSIPAVGDLNATVSNAVTAGEVVTMLVTSFVDVNDGVTIAEAVQLSIESYISVADGITVGETTQLELESNVAVSDAVAVADTPTARTELNISVSDGIAIAEVTTLTVSDPQVLVAEAVTVGEALSLNLASAGIVTVVVADGIAIGEVTTASVSDPQVLVADAISVSDAPIANITEVGALSIAVSDGITVGETIQTELENSIAVSDSITVGESVTVATVAVSDLAISVSDGVVLSEQVSLLLPELYIGLTDSVTVTDLPAALLTKLFVGTSDAISVSDTPAVSIAVAVGTLEITVTDAITITDLAYIGFIIATIDLTLRTRSTSLTLDDRGTGLTLKTRQTGLTLKTR